MPTNKKNTKGIVHKNAKPRPAVKAKTNAVKSTAVGNYDNDPFFVKKAKAARELLLKVGLPTTIKVKTS